jgi:hypothetical protein
MERNAHEYRLYRGKRLQLLNSDQTCDHIRQRPYQTNKRLSKGDIMEHFKITVQKVTQREDESYSRDVTVYEQIVSGDDTIVNAVARTVLDYNSPKYFEQPVEEK